MILFVNACVRKQSRTKCIADSVLSGKSFTEVKLGEQTFPTVDENYLAQRDKLIAQGCYEHPMFALARQFAAADEIVIAAPFWDLSFPAMLKQYFEQINVLGITFSWTNGVPRGLCKAKKLTYITTAGGEYFPEEYGFGYVNALAQGFYGIKDVRLIKATGLDMDVNDPDAIIRTVITNLNQE